MIDNFQYKKDFNYGLFLNQFLNQSKYTETLCYGLSNGLYFEYNFTTNQITGFNPAFIDIFCENNFFYTVKQNFIYDDNKTIDNICFLLRNKSKVPLSFIENNELNFALIEDINQKEFVVSFDNGEKKIYPINYFEYKNTSFFDLKIPIIYLIYKNKKVASIQTIIVLSLIKNLYAYLSLITIDKSSHALEKLINRNFINKGRTLSDERLMFGNYLIESSKILENKNLFSIGENYNDLSNLWAIEDTFTPELFKMEKELAYRTLDIIQNIYLKG